MKDWSRERWRKLYLRESKQQSSTWLLIQRGIRDYCIKVAEDDGTLAVLNDPDEDPVELLVGVLNAHERERDLALESVANLLDDGFLAFDGTRVFVANLPAAQGDEQLMAEEAPAPTRAPRARAEAKDLTGAARSKRYRDARKGRDGVTGVTSDRHGQRHVNRHDPSRSTVTVPAVTASRDNSQKIASESLLSQPDQTERPDQTGARVTREERDGDRDDKSVTERYVTAVTREPRNLAEALALPLAERARLLAGPGASSRASWLAPHEWPEVIAAAKALAAATGKSAHARVSEYGRDAGVRAVVAIYAEWSQDEFERAIAFVVKSEWWGRDTRGLSSFTAEVMRRAVAASQAGAAPVRADVIPRPPKKTREEQGFVPPPAEVLDQLGLPAGTSAEEAVGAVLRGVRAVK